MKDFISKFSKKKNDKPEDDIEAGGGEQHKDDVIDIDDSGPSISASTRNKILIFLGSAILITLTIYFFIIKEDAPKQTPEENLEQIPSVGSGQSPQSGPSPFEFDPLQPQQGPTKTQAQYQSDNLDVATPPPPSLPPLPQGQGVVDGFLNSDGQRAGQQPGAMQQPQAQQQGVPQEQQKPPADPKNAPIVVVVGSGGPTDSIGSDNNIVSINNDDFGNLRKTDVQIKATYLENRDRMVGQGKFMEVVIENAIDTELEGSLRAIVSRDVYAETGNEVLIPRGSRLFGSYTSSIAKGQGRLQIVWTRLIRPDGVDAQIGFFASDQFGRSGIKGEVDNRYGTTILQGILTSALTLGTAAAANSILGSGNQQTTTTASAGTGTVMTSEAAASRAAYDATKAIVDTVGKVISNGMSDKPVIRVPQGTKIIVTVNADMILPKVKKTNRIQNAI